VLQVFANKLYNSHLNAASVDLFFVVIRRLQASLTIGSTSEPSLFRAVFPNSFSPLVNNSKFKLQILFWYICPNWKNWAENRNLNCASQVCLQAVRQRRTELRKLITY